MALRNILRSPAALSDHERALSVRDAGTFAAALVAWILFAALVFIQIDFEPEHPLYLVQASVMLNLGGIVMASLKVFLAFGLALGISQAFENSKIGHRYGGPHVIFAALILAAGFIFAVPK
jgi:hypothetical protein